MQELFTGIQLFFIGFGFIGCTYLEYVKIVTAIVLMLLYIFLAVLDDVSFCFLSFLAQSAFSWIQLLC